MNKNNEFVCSITISVIIVTVILSIKKVKNYRAILGHPTSCWELLISLKITSVTN